MTKHICDRCGQQMSRWVSFTPGVDVSNPMMNVADIIRYQTQHEYCTTCWATWLEDCARERQHWEEDHDNV